MIGEFSFPTRVLFAPGAVDRLPEVVRGWGRQALIVTDHGVAGSGALRPVLDALAGADLDYRVFDGTEANPTLDTVEAGLERFRDDCDYLIAVGGGSPMDAAKAIRLAATHPMPLEQYDDKLGGSERIHPTMPPMVAIPTTAGTGSEVGRSTVITLSGRKTVIFSPHLIPTVAICDPALTVGLPQKVTAGTGADALTHNLEAFFAKGYHPLCDGIALEGIRKAIRWLPVAVNHPRELLARAEMMAAALMGGVAFQKGLGATHSLSHPLSSIAGVHHGTANAIMLPHVLRFNAPAIQESAHRCADALGIEADESDPSTPERIADHLQALFHGLGLPTRLREVGVTHTLVDALAGLAMLDECHLSNPRPVTREDMVALYAAAL